MENLNFAQFGNGSDSKEINVMDSGDLQKRINKYIESAISIHFASISHNINQRLEQIENNIKADSREHKELKELLQSISGEFNKFAGLYYKDRQTRIETRDKLLQNRETRGNDPSTKSEQSNSENVQVESKELGTDIGDYKELLKGFTKTVQLNNKHLYEIWNLIASNKPDNVEQLKGIVKPYLSAIGKPKAKEMGIKVFHYVSPLFHGDFFDTLMENMNTFKPPKSNPVSTPKEEKKDTVLIKPDEKLQKDIESFSKEFKIPASGNNSINQLITELRKANIKLTEENELPENVQDYILDKFHSGQLRKFGLRRQLIFLTFLAKSISA